MRALKWVLIIFGILVVLCLVAWFLILPHFIEIPGL